MRSSLYGISALTTSGTRPARLMVPLTAWPGLTTGGNKSQFVGSPIADMIQLCGDVRPRPSTKRPRHDVINDQRSVGEPPCLLSSLDVVSVTGSYTSTSNPFVMYSFWYRTAAS